MLIDQVGHRPRRHRPHGRSAQCRHRQKRFEAVGLEPLVQILTYGHGQNTQQGHHLAVAHAADLQGSLEPRPQLPQGMPLQVRRGLRPQGIQRPGQQGHLRLKCGEGRRIRTRQGGHVGAGALRIPPEGQRVTVRGQTGRHRRRFHPSQAVRFQLQVRDHVGMEKAGIQCAEGHAASRDTFLAGGQPAEQGAPLQQQGPPAGPGQRGGADQAVVAAADDDGVISGHQGFRRLMWRSSSTRSAASRPGAPMIPPPGCVPDPHW